MLPLAAWLALSVLGSSPPAFTAHSGLPTYVRTQLDGDASPLRGPPSPRAPRRIRSTLDDASHAAFPLAAEGRLIRVSLDDDDLRYGHLSPSQSRLRRVRRELD